MLRRVFLAVLAFSALASPVASQALPLVPFEGLLRPDGPVVAEGSVTTDAGGAKATWSTAPTLSGSLGIAAERATVHVWEWTWQTVHVGGGPGRSDQYAFSTPEKLAVSSHSIERPKVNFTSRGLPADWLLASPQGRLALGSAECLLSSIAPEPMDFQRVSTGPLPGARQVEARCRSGTIEASGPQTLYAYNTTLVASSAVATKSAFKSSAREALQLPLGAWSQPNPTMPGTTDHLVRVAAIEIGDASGRMAPPAGEVRLVAPALATQGAIRIPASRGDLSWGGLRFQDVVQPIRPEGALSITAPDEALAFGGRTTNEPPAAAAAAPDARGQAPAAILAGVVGLAALLAAPARSLLLGLFTRLDEDDALANERRQAILAYVREHPGAGMHVAVAELRLPRRSVRYHVGVLARQGLLQARQLGSRTFLFVPGAVDWSQQAAHAKVQQPIARELLARRAADPNRTQSQLAADLGISQGYVSRVLKSLDQHGLVAPPRSAALDAAALNHAAPGAPSAAA